MQKPANAVAANLRRGDLITRLEHPAMSFDPVAPTEAVIRAIRDARFADGVYCPHCLSRAVCRWGTFTGRQRYRCRSCKRTFSDLTATAAAWIKKLDLWVGYAVGMAGSLTLRRSAVLLRTTPSTTFRWRHRVLRSLCAGDAATQLSGLIELDETGFAYSEKGRRKLSRPARQRGVWEDLRKRWLHPRVSVPIAIDRSGRSLSAVLLCDHANFEDLRVHVLPRTVAPATFLVTQGPLGRCTAPLRRHHRAHTMPKFGQEPGPHVLHHTHTVRSYIRRFRIWLLRFRGVATRYLPHYLAWHLLLDGVDEGVTGSLFFRRMSAQFGALAGSSP